MRKLYPLLVLPAVATVLFLMGRPWLCACGTVKFWHGLANSPETSQQLLDWYSLTHVMHGMIFCILLAAACRRFNWRPNLSRQYLYVMLFGAAWEIFENTPFLVERYRQTAISNGYTGDTILNSIADICCVALGYALARRISRTWSVALILAAELLLLYTIHDNLLLNVIMLLHPVPAINAWQATAA